MDSTYRAHYNFEGKTKTVDFSLPKGEIDSKTKHETAIKMIKEKNPDFDSKTVVISKVDFT